MFGYDIENLKSLVCELEGELESGNNDEAAATIDYIFGICSSLLTKLEE